MARGTHIGKLVLVNNTHQVRVVEDIAKLIGDVTIVHVDGAGADLPGRVHTLQIGVVVIEI